MVFVNQLSNLGLVAGLRDGRPRLSSRSRSAWRARKSDGVTPGNMLLLSFSGFYFQSLPDPSQGVTSLGKGIMQIQ